MIKTADRLNGIGEYYFSQKLREIDTMNREGKAVINLGIGSPDLPPHPDVVDVLQKESAKPNVHAYQSYKGSPILRNAVSEWYQKWYGVKLDPESEVLPLIGSKEGIMHICMTYLNIGDKVLVPNPGYPTYRSAVKLAGGECVDYELKEDNNYQPDLSQIENTDGSIKLMFVNYPHMPTGQLPLESTFSNLVQWAKSNNVLIVHDNPYSFILNEHPASLLSVDGAKDLVIELNSLSKSQNMAGWRVGVLVGAKERIDEVLRFKSNMDSGMFLPVQLAAAKALSLGKEWYDSVNRTYRERREIAYRLLDLLGCMYSKNQAGMFVWARIPDHCNSGYELSDEVLYQSNVFITPGGIFGTAGEQYVRVSLCSPVEKLLEAINRISTKTKLHKAVNG
ncbi:MAG: aminotransferase class I/II-fold pyridoxal phosphate-dependent enzyme [Chitinophagaceae bacterium]|nr:aminotransferase class I/II-fold pyridoxal phosphate-dependent enzyme [Chitinophagaceae bacterium]